MKRYLIISLLTVIASCGALLAGATTGEQTAREPDGLFAEPLPPEKAEGLGAHAQSGSLCRSDEQIIFTCRVGNAPKYISLCGSRQLAANEGYVQYRFGRAGQIEFEFPRQKDGTQQAFRYTHYFRAQVDRTEVTFENGGYKYLLYDYYDGEQKPTVKESGMMVNGTDGGRKESEFKCRGRALNHLSALASVVPNDKN